MKPHTLGRLALLGLLAVSACAATEVNQEGRALEPPGDAAEGAAPDAGLPPTVFQDAGASDPSPQGIVLVNASRQFPAFRLCKATEDKPSTRSISLVRPFPTTRMPSSSLSGVDINGAVRIDRQEHMGSDSTAILVSIDDQTKGTEVLETASCRALVCGAGTGGYCLPSAKLRRVTVLQNGAPLPGAFSEPGRMLVLRDAKDGSDEVYFDAIDVRPREATKPGRLLVQYRSFSTFDGNLRFTGGNQSFEIAADSERSVPLAVDSWAATTLTAGAYTASFDDIHRASEPNVPVADYYRTQSLFVLLLLGDSRPDSGPNDRPLKLLAVPMAAPRVSVLPGNDDAGTDGSAPRDAAVDSQDASPD